MEIIREPEVMELIEVAGIKLPTIIFCCIPGGNGGNVGTPTADSSK